MKIERICNENFYRTGVYGQTSWQHIVKAISAKEAKRFAASYFNVQPRIVWAMKLRETQQRKLKERFIDAQPNQ